MKKLILFLIVFLFVFNLIYAQKIKIDYPVSVDFGKEFKIKVKMINFSEDIYDIKIDILNNKTRLSKIWNKKNWQTTFRYVNKIINLSKTNNQDFKLNITKKFNGNADIIVKIRNSNSKSEIFEGYKINIKSDLEENLKNKEEENNTKIMQNKNNKQENITENSLLINNKKKENSDEIKEKEIKESIIKLNSETYSQKKDIKNEKFIIYESKTEIIKKYSIYGFAFLCVLLSILLIWDKL